MKVEKMKNAFKVAEESCVHFWSIRHHHQAREKMEVQMETHLPFFRKLKKDCINAWFYAPEPQISNVETIIEQL